MKSTRKIRFFTSTTTTYSSSPTTTTTEIPVDSSQPPDPVPITVHLPTPNYYSTTAAAAAAAKIQSSYRSYVIRKLIKKISSVKKETDRIQRLIQRQETVDTLRSHNDEGNKLKLRINEELMKEILKLDAIPGFDPVVREQRKWMSRRIVGLQEVLDWICSGGGWDDGEMSWRSGWDWDEVIGCMEGEVCRERGGEGLDKFCVENLGFRCFERFLRE